MGAAGTGLPRYGHDTHALSWRVAPGIPASGGGQPLLSAAERRADPDHPGSNSGAGADRPRGPEAGRRARDATGAYAFELDRWPPELAGGVRLRDDVGHGRASLQ